ncbi:MAG: hypothetical protein K0R29_943 [Pseudobdellovibrio sp.]|jgi:uncharacterized protein (TIGR00251 family)|nr:hypothetical protein [Pseudobdellovibrio sp.]
MKITVSVKPNSRTEKVEQAADGSYLVKVNAPPSEGKANERVIELLSDYFKVPKSRIELASGAKSKKKVFKIG